MLISGSAEFLDRFALDRQLLAEFVEMPSMKGDPSEAIDLGGPGSTGKILHMQIVESLSGQAIEEYKGRLRPLFFGTAWRVLDGLIELALVQDSNTPPGQMGWQPAKKAALLPARGTLSEVPNAILLPVKALYLNTIEIRHALIHRKTAVAANGALVGHTNAGVPLPAVSTDQQVRMCELAQWLALAIENGSLTNREQRRVMALLTALVGLHGQAIAPPPPLGGVTFVKYQLDDSYVLDLTTIRARVNESVNDSFGMDLQLVTVGGTFLAGEVEGVPDSAVVVDLSNLPPWLHVTHPGADMP